MPPSSCKIELMQNRVSIKLPPAETLIWVLMLLAALFRVALYLKAADLPYLAYRVGDETYYHDWASRIAGGQFMGEQAFFTSPLYAYFLGMLYAVAGDSIALIRGVNMLLGLGAIYLVFLSSRRFFPGRLALLPPLICAFSFVPLFYELFPEKTTLVFFTTSLSFYMILRCLDPALEKPHSPARWAMAGFITGIATLGHALLMAFIPALALSAFFIRHTSRRRAAILMGYFLAAFFLALVPSAIHNYMKSGDVILIAYNGGHNLYMGNHTGNRTGLYTSPKFASPDMRSEEIDFKAEAERRAGRVMSPGEVSSYWSGQAMKEIMDNPGLSARRFWLKLRWAVGAKEVTDTRTYEFYKSKLPLMGAPLWGFGLVSTLGLAGLALVLGRREYALISVFALAYTGGLVLFFVYGRYRVPLLLPMSILGTYALVQVYEWAKERDIKKAIAALVLISAIGFPVNTKVIKGMETSFLPNYYNQAVMYFNEGRKDLAIRELELAITHRPGDHPGIYQAIVSLSVLYEEEGRYDKALNLMRRAVERYPGRVEFQERLRGLEGE